MSISQIASVFVDSLPKTLNNPLQVMAEMEKLGPKYRIALQIARDERWHRLVCDHKGTYADGR